MPQFEQIEIPDLNELEANSSNQTYNPPQNKQLEAPINLDHEERKPTAEYALHILFTRFVRYTEKKLAKFDQLSGYEIEHIFGEGVEPEFDMILESLGHVARRLPKPIIDSIMYWLHTKRDKNNGKNDASLYVSCRALMEVITQAPHDVLGEKLCSMLEENIFKQLLQNEQGNIISEANWKYLAKLLGEMSSFRLASVDDKFISELEQKRSNKQQDARALLLLKAMQYLKIKLYPEEFLEESSAFLESLSKFYTQTPFSSQLRAKFAISICQILEPLAETITVEVNQPMWSNTMQTLFKASQEQVHERFTLNRGSNATSSVNAMPAFALSVMSLCLSPQPIFSENWLKLLEQNYSKTKTARNIQLFPAAARLTWVYMFRCSESLNLTTKKIESLRKMLLSNQQRKYWQQVEADLEARQSAVSLVRSCFQGYQQFTLDEVLFRLLVGQDANSAQSSKTAFDSVLPERASIAVDAFIEIMSDLKSGNRPPFPSKTSSQQVQVSSDGLSGAKESLLTKSELPYRPQVSQALQASIDLFGTCIGEISGWLEQGGLMSETSSRQNSVSHLKVSFSSQSSQPSLAELERNKLGLRTMEQYLLLLFLKSWPSWWKPEQHLRFLDVLSRCVGHPIMAIREAAVVSCQKIGLTADLKQLLTPFSKAMMATDAKSSDISELQVPSLFHSSYMRRNSEQSERAGHGHSFSLGSGNSLSLNLGLGLHTSSNSNDFDQNPMQLDLQNPASANTSVLSLNTTQQQRSLAPQHKVLSHLQLYVELIEEWIKRLQNGDAAVTGSSVDAQILGLWAAVEEIEGNGLYFLCSQDVDIRSQGLRILWLTTEMDQAILNYREAQDSSSGKAESKPLRVITLLQNTPISQVANNGNKRFQLNGPELQRLSMFGSKRASLARLAESRFGVDSAVWRKLFPSVINMCFESHPIPMALCRNLIIDRLGQMYETVNEISTKAQQFDATTMGIIEQWKNYLIVACATLTSTEEQKIYVPPAPAPTTSNNNTPNHSKKPSQKLTLHHKRITSIKSVFRIVAPMLKSENNTIREAMVTGLSCTNVNTFKTLLECLQPILSQDIQKLQQLQSTQVKSGQQSQFDPLLRSVTCITQVFTHTTNLLETKEVRQDMWIRTEIVSMLHQLRELLGPMQSMEVSPLRVSFCELLADTYNALKPSLMFYGRNPAREWLQFWRIVEHWSPFGVNAGAVLESRSAMKRRAQNDVVLAQLEVMNREIDKATSRAIAALFVDSQEFISDLGPALHWVYTCLATNSHSSSQEIGRIALENLLLSHASRQELLLDVIGRCYHNTSERSRGVAKVYFVALVNILESHPHLIKEKVDKPQQFFALALFKIGDPDCETRFRAVKLIEIVENGLYGSSVLSGEYQFKLRSTSPSVYKREIFVLSGKLAITRSHESFYLFSQMARAFQTVNDSDRRDILSVLLPWIQNIEFKPDDDSGLQMVIVNLLEITTVFSGRMQHEVEALWIALCTSQTGASSNALRILDFLLSFCLQYRSHGAVSISRTVLIYLLASPASAAITEKLLDYLEPKHMITQSGKPFSELVSPESENEYPYVASLTDIVNLANEKAGKGKNKILPSFSYGQLAVVFLVDTISTATPVLSQLSSLIHVCVVLGDHFVGLVQEKTRELLLNLAGMFNPEPEAMERFTKAVTHLRWRYEDDSGQIPDQLCELVKAILEHLGANDILDSREWAQTAIQWATTSPVRHIACRSLQIYRSLDLQLDLKMLGDVLARLSGTISEQSADIQGFSTQILMTLNSIIDNLDNNQLVAFPHLFWASVASLSTANEREYIEGLSSINKLLSKWSDDFAWAVVSTFPSKWECDLDDFEGCLSLILRGLRSENSCELCHTVGNQLIKLSENSTENDSLLFFGSKNPLPQLLTASVPWLLTAMDQPHLISRLVEPAQILQRLVKPFSSGMCRILESFEKRRLWSKPDFLRQFFLAFVAAFPQDTVEAMILVMSMVNNGAPHIRKAALDILHVLVPEVKLLETDNSNWCRADLIAPLLRLLTTPDVEEALQVLDLFGYVKPDRKDKDVLRMTLGSRHLFREYDNTETLFGIPDEAGWSVPLPTQASMITKANIHAVFYTCASTESSLPDSPFGSIDDDGSAQQFQLEEYGPTSQHNYTHSTSHIVGNHQAGFESMDKILTDLDEYDSFFTRAAAPMESPSTRSPAQPKHRSMHISLDERPIRNSNQSDNQVRRARSVSETESIPQLYDKKVSVILNQSLARTPSQVSFKSTFGDSFGRALSTSSTQQTSQTSTTPSTGVAPPPHSRTSSFAYAQANNSSHIRQNSRQQFDPTASLRRQTSLDSTTTIGDSDLEFRNNSDLYRSSSRQQHTQLNSSFDMSIMNSELNSDDQFDWPPRNRVAGTLEEYDFFPANEPHTPNSKQPRMESISPTHKLPSKSASPESNSSAKKQPQAKITSESSFRLESLLRGRRKGKTVSPKPKSKTPEKAPKETFQFPPR